MVLLEHQGEFIHAIGRQETAAPARAISGKGKAHRGGLEISLSLPVR